MKQLALILLTLIVTGPQPAFSSKPSDTLADSPVEAPVPKTHASIGYTDTEFIPGQTKWRVHDASRPAPRIVTAGTTSTAVRPGQPPSDAVVLFDGSSLSQWVGDGDKPAAWKVENGYLEINGTGTIHTKQGFGSCQLHIEWATPAEVKGDSQGRGNSGVMIMGLYEIQVLDSFDNRTYSDGQAAAIYGQYPPLVNASRGPGQWQTFDIIFEAPQFEGEELIRPAYVTLFHNGVLVHHHAKLLGRVAHKFPAKYAPHADKLPLSLQDHGNPGRYRNIWIRPLTAHNEVTKK